MKTTTTTFVIQFWSKINQRWLDGAGEFADPAVAQGQARYLGAAGNGQSSYRVVRRTTTIEEETVE